jgi:carbon storage regulator
MGRLVLTRKIGESILIGEDIIVSITGYDRGAIRVSIVAPTSVPVVRSEIKGTPRKKDLQVKGTRPVAYPSITLRRRRKRRCV